MTVREDRVMTGPGLQDSDVVFAGHRPALVGAAYRILGSHADAEDVVQDVWLRWSKVDFGTVENPRAFLVTMTGRLALNLLRTRKRQRESYVGPWLPEPVATDDHSDPEKAVVLADEVSMAMLVVLETLSPLERAAFVLTEVFAMPAPEVAAALDRTPAAVRQLVHRARSHVQSRPPRQAVAEPTLKALTDQFLVSAATGDLDGLMSLLAPDIVLVTDGGGLKQAALRPIHGADKVARWWIGITSRFTDNRIAVELRRVNGETAVVLSLDGEVDSVIFLTVVDNRIAEILSVRNPEKLHAL